MTEVIIWLKQMRYWRRTVFIMMICPTYSVQGSTNVSTAISTCGYYSTDASFKSPGKLSTVTQSNIHWIKVSNKDSVSFVEICTHSRILEHLRMQLLANECFPSKRTTHVVLSVSQKDLALVVDEAKRPLFPELLEEGQFREYVQIIDYTAHDK